MSRKMWRTVLVEPGRFLRERAALPEPGPGELLIKVNCVGVCGSDIYALHGLHPYIRCPIVLGHEFSGTVEALGPGVSAPMAGTRVTVIPHVVCGECEACSRQLYNYCEALRVLGAQADGAHADYILVPADMALPIPAAMSMQQAAMVEPIAVSYHGMRRANIGAKDRVMIVGVGPIGNFAMQSARALGARAVYVADLDSDRLRLAESLGADGAIDLSKESLTDGLDRLACGAKKIDVWSDCVGRDGAALESILALARRGSRVAILGVLGTEYNLPHLPDFVQHELTLYGNTMYVPQDYRDVIKHVASGRIRTDGMITHTYGLDEISNAFAMIESGAQKFFKIMFTAEPRRSAGK